MAYFSGQGRVYLAQRDPNGNPLALRWVGNVPDLKITLNVETMEHKESYSGQRLTDLQLIKGKDGEFSCTLEDLSSENLELSLYGVTSTVTAGTVSGEKLADGIVAGETRLLANQFVSGVVIKDSSGTPKTLPAAQYTVHANQGAITFSDLSTGGPYTQPFLVDYAYGAARRTAMFKSAMPELWLRFDGINTADANKPVIVDLYRVAINPTKDLSLIGDDLQKFELTGRVLADLGKSETGALGRFGRLIVQG
ncbi:MAG: hypothetical protein JJ713_05665 [Acidithiobacillus sp.]|uniref:phage tail tube protein n=1 Tax=Acidithiobacillus sp. TaxID=1872118 RepID=UPI00258263AC|nr:hypothetical protein [Acidithiobacillus sp.]MCE5420256.1 hypothetical protein [Acidithiobacillus sp.]